MSDQHNIASNTNDHGGRGGGRGGRGGRGRGRGGWMNRGGRGGGGDDYNREIPGHMKEKAGRQASPQSPEPSPFSWRGGQRGRGVPSGVTGGPFARGRGGGAQPSQNGSSRTQSPSSPTSLVVNYSQNGFSQVNGYRDRGVRSARGMWSPRSDNSAENGGRIGSEQDMRGEGFNYRGRGGTGFGQRGRGNGWGDSSGGGRGRGGGQPWRGGRGGAREIGASFGGRHFGSSTFEDNLPPARDMMENLLVPQIQELSIPEASASDHASMKNFECIGSYTWAKQRNATIIVPGSPREWLDRPFPFRVPFDNGIRMFHEDAFHMGAESTLLPLFRAVDALRANASSTGVDDDPATRAIDWAAVDFVTDRNNLRKLLRWVREPAPPTEAPVAASPVSPTSSDGAGGSEPATADSWDPRKDFRIDMQLGGTKTVLMHRWAVSTRERVVPPKAGCRSNFERESTAAARGCENGEGHYRIVQYDLGGLKMVVRFEVDACVTSIASAPAADAQDVVEPASDGSDTQSATADIAPVPEVTKDERTTTSSEVPTAPQSITSPSDTEYRGVQSSAADWGDLEPIVKDTKGAEKVNKVDSEVLDPEREAAAWMGPVNDADAWLSPAPSPISSKAAHSRKVDEPEPAMTGWELPNDPSDWGARNDAAEGWEIKDDPAAWDAPTEINPGPQNSPFVPIPDLTIIRAGTLLPQSSVFELSTRSIRFADRTSSEDIFLQLFLTQTPTHLVAVHQSGTFEKIVRQDLDSPEFAVIAENDSIKTNLAQFVRLLRKIQNLVQEHGATGRVSLICEKGKLALFGRMGEGERVSDSELGRFEERMSLNRNIEV